MKEKFTIPQADRLVGTGPVKSMENKEDEVSRDPEEILKREFAESGSYVYKIELEKTEEDLALVQLVETSVKEYAAQYGREFFLETTPGHIHFLPDGGVLTLTKGRLATGSHSTVWGEVLIDKRDDISTAITLFHELWHMLASHQAIQVTTNQELASYRSGFSMKSRDGATEHFHSFDEALVGYMTERFVNEKLSQAPGFKEKVQDLRQAQVLIDTTRQRELKGLWEFIDNLLQKNSNTFSSREEIMNLFIRGQVTGNVLPAARLIESTYGKGSFRKISKF
ncbi:MAG: hypothetical protein NTV60_02680 [Candidatus Kaiserbacteria bacterium]|nr:hypothetical protein [Candidatus Kaiserbacteria bacterium]